MVKRASEERKRLPPELEAFARSDEEKLRIRRPRIDRGRVNDPREGYVIPGVANRDARAVYDQRVNAMQELWNGGSADEGALETLGELLLDAQRLELWRARRVMGFEVFCDDVLGLSRARARELAETASLRLRESPAPLSERDVALWMRTEAGLFEGEPQARVRLRSTLTGPVLELRVALANASAALAGAGVRHAPLVRGPEQRGPGELRGAAEPRERRPPRRGESEEHALRGDGGASDAVEEAGQEGRAASASSAGSSAGTRLLTRKPRAEAPDEPGFEARDFARQQDASRPRAREERERSFEERGRGARESSAPRGTGGHQGAVGGGAEGRRFDRREGGFERRGGGRFGGDEGPRGGFAKRDGGGRGERSFGRRDEGPRGGFAKRDGGGRGERSFARRDEGAPRGERSREGSAAAGERGFGTRGGGGPRGERSFGGDKKPAGRKFGGKPAFGKAAAGGGFRGKVGGGKGGFVQGGGKGGFAQGGGKGGFGQKRVFSKQRSAEGEPRRERPRRDDDSDE